MGLFRRRGMFWVMVTGALAAVWLRLAWEGGPRNAAREELLHPEARLLARAVAADFDRVPLEDALAVLGREACCTVAVPLGREAAWGAYGQAEGVRVRATARSSGPIALGEAIDMVVASVRPAAVGAGVFTTPAHADWRETGAVYVGPANDFYEHGAMTVVYEVLGKGVVDEKAAFEAREGLAAELAKQGRKGVTVRVVGTRLVVTADAEAQEAAARWLGGRREGE